MANEFKIKNGAIVTGSILATGDLNISGGDIDLKNGGSPSNVKLYCESSNAHYTQLQAASHSAYSGNVLTVLPAYDFNFSMPNFQANITASGHISSSIASTASLGQLEVSGEITVPRYIRRRDDADTYVEFLSNKLQLQAGGIPFITVDKDAATPYPLTINNGGNRVNFRVVDENSDLLLKTDSEKYKVNLYYAGDQKLETRTDGINVTGSIYVSSSGTFVGDGSTLTNLQRPITSSAVNFTASADNAGYYFRTGGNVTCSIQTNANVAIPTGTEYELFQTASAGNLLIESGSSTITVNSKDGNIKLAGQFSAATLKKVGTDEWDLIGDLG